MKYAHIIDNNLMGWYDSNIHTTIPIPKVEVTETVWQEALNINANYYDGKAFSHKAPTLTDVEVANQVIYDRKYLGIDYTNLEDEVYKVSLTNDDANGLIQVKTAFEFGVTETNFYFENGTVVPLKSIDDLLHLGQFVSIERNKFFL